MDIALKNIRIWALSLLLELGPAFPVVSFVEFGIKS